jgi:hypothetical protein
MLSREELIDQIFTGTITLNSSLERQNHWVARETLASHRGSRLKDICNNKMNVKCSNNCIISTRIFCLAATGVQLIFKSVNNHSTLIDVPGEKGLA